MRKVIAVAVCLLAIGVSPATAAADPPVPPRAFAGPQAKFYGYLTPVVTVAPEDDLIFSSFDLERHNFVQDVAVDGFGGPKKMPWCEKGHHQHGGKAPLCPIFWSKLIGLNETTPVEGLQNVKSGTTYTFFCSLHHGMKGKLIVQ